MRVLAIIQARMGSSRLPGKMLLPIIHGRGPLELMAERVRRSKRIDELHIATTDASADDELADLCVKLGLPCFRGSEEDVLDRFYQTVKAAGSFDTVVRLTGDCPLHDPEVIDLVIERFGSADADYVSNVNPPTYPDGLDTEVFSSTCLERAWHEAELRSGREHVTLHIRNNPEKYRLANVRHETDLSALRWTLDEKRDLEMIRGVYRGLYDDNPAFNLADVLAFLRNNPGIAAKNADIARNEGLAKSLAEDGINDE